MHAPSYSTSKIRSLKVTLLAAVCALLTQPSTGYASTLLRGENRTCRDYADLDYALDHPDSLYFKGWSSEDFDAARTWIESCFATPPTSQDKERQSLLAHRRAALEARGEVLRNDEIVKNMRETELQDQRTNEAQIRAEETARRAGEVKELANSKAKQAADAKVQAAREECLRSFAYQKYMSASHIVSALDRE